MASAIARSPTFGMPPRGRRRLQRGALYVVLASVAVSAAMGAFALLIGGFGETQGNLLVSSLSVTGASAIAVACGFAWERGRLGVVPPAGVALGIAGFALLVVGIWTEPEGYPFQRASGTPLALAVAATHASLVSPFGLARRFRAAFAAAYGLNALLTALVVYAIWAEPDEGGFWRFTGTVAILVAAATIAIPVLHRLGPAAPSFQPAEAAAAAEAVEAAAALAARYCPRCGAGLERPGAGRCERCGAGFAVRFRAAR